MIPPLLSETTRFLRPVEHGKLLCTCRRVNEECDHAYLWKRHVKKYVKRFPRGVTYKRFALIKDALRKYTAYMLLREATTLKSFLTNTRVIFRVCSRQEIRRTLFCYINAKERQPYHTQARGMYIIKFNAPLTVEERYDENTGRLIRVPTF